MSISKVLNKSFTVPPDTPISRCVKLYPMAYDEAKDLLMGSVNTRMLNFRISNEYEHSSLQYMNSAVYTLYADGLKSETLFPCLETVAFKATATEPSHERFVPPPILEAAALRQLKQLTLQHCSINADRMLLHAFFVDSEVNHLKLDTVNLQLPKVESQNFFQNKLSSSIEKVTFFGDCKRIIIDTVFLLAKNNKEDNCLTVRVNPPHNKMTYDYWNPFAEGRESIRGLEMERVVFADNADYFFDTLSENTQCLYINTCIFSLNAFNNLLAYLKKQQHLVAFKFAGPLVILGENSDGEIKVSNEDRYQELLDATKNLKTVSILGFPRATCTEAIMIGETIPELDVAHVEVGVVYLKPGEDHPGASLREGLLENPVLGIFLDKERKEWAQNNGIYGMTVYDVPDGDKPYTNYSVWDENDRQIAKKHCQKNKTDHEFDSTQD